MLICSDEGFMLYYYVRFACLNGNSFVWLSNSQGTIMKVSVKLVLNILRNDILSWFTQWALLFQTTWPKSVSLKTETIFNPVFCNLLSHFLCSTFIPLFLLSVCRLRLLVLSPDGCHAGECLKAIMSCCLVIATWHHTTGHFLSYNNIIQTLHSAS